MSRNYHSTELIGRLATSPETKYSQNNGTAVTKLKVLVNEQWKDSAGHEQKHVESYSVVCFNSLAEACGNCLSTGTRVFVRGRNRTRSYDKDGTKRYVTELIADTIVFLDSPRENESDQHPAPGHPELQSSQISDDVPFDSGPRHA